MTAKERLLAQEDLVDLMIKHQYIPHASQQNFGEMLAALREVNPTAKYDPGCSGCMMEIANAAKLFINKFKKEQLPPEEPKFMTFPKQDKPVETIEVQVDRPGKRPRRVMSEEHKQAIKDAHAKRKNK